MTFKTQKFIIRQNLKDHPDWIFVFGDNEKHIGYGGQAREMRGEFNAYGIPTKKTPGHSEADYWSENDWERQNAIIYEKFKHLYTKLSFGYNIIFPEFGIGTGLSELPKRAPTTMKYINEWIKTLKKDFGE